MKLKNFLIVVNDIEKSKSFYCELFGFKVLRDFGENVILTEGLVLQERGCYEEFTGLNVTLGGNATELYFEEEDLDGFLKKLEVCEFDVEFVNRESGIIRICDPDKHIIEIREPMK